MIPRKTCCQPHGVAIKSLAALCRRIGCHSTLRNAFQERIETFFLVIVGSFPTGSAWGLRNHSEASPFLKEWQKDHSLQRSSSSPSIRRCKSASSDLVSAGAWPWVVSGFVGASPAPLGGSSTKLLWITKNGIFIPRSSAIRASAI